MLTACEEAKNFEKQLKLLFFIHKEILMKQNVRKRFLPQNDSTLVDDYCL